MSRPLVTPFRIKIGDSVNNAATIYVGTRQSGSIKVPVNTTLTWYASDNENGNFAVAVNSQGAAISYDAVAGWHVIPAELFSFRFLRLVASAAGAQVVTDCVLKEAT